MAARLRIASWNVNSLRVRLQHVLDWLDATTTDILGLQETKVTDDAFPTEAFAEAGYDCVYSGQKTYNGVALVSRRDTVTERLGPPRDTLTDLPGADDPARRVLVASYGQWRIANLYVPNGQSVGAPKYDYKLDWLALLADFVRDESARHERLVVLGDFNIAPEDRDVHDPELWRGKILCSDAERDALAAVMAPGLVDTFRAFEEDGGIFSWWDYRAAAFRRNRGLRIDLILASPGAAADLAAAHIDPAPRRLERPSDHTPTVAEFTI